MCQDRISLVDLFNDPMQVYYFGIFMYYCIICIEADRVTFKFYKFYCDLLMETVFRFDFETLLLDRIIFINS